MELLGIIYLMVIIACVVEAVTSPNFKDDFTNEKKKTKQ